MGLCRMFRRGAVDVRRRREQRSLAAVVIIMGEGVRWRDIRYQYVVRQGGERHEVRKLKGLGLSNDANGDEEPGPFF